MQNTPSIENSEINVSMNRQFSVFSLCNFAINNRQITYILFALKIKKRWQNKKVKNAFLSKNKNVKAFLHLWTMMRGPCLKTISAMTYDVLAGH